MSPKLYITLGLVIGTTVGGYVPLLWGDASLFSFSSTILTFVGGLIGVWAGYQMSR